MFIYILINLFNNNELKTQLNYRIHKLILTIVSTGILYKFTVRRSGVWAGEIILSIHSL